MAEGQKLSVQLEEISTTSQQRFPNADAKTDKAAKPIGRRRIWRIFFFSE